MSRHEDIQELIDRLRALMASSPIEKVGLRSWYNKAEECEALLKRSRDLDDVVPHSVWHYLADADTRAKDPGYRESQQAEIADTIRTLEAALSPVAAV
jgi:hypothetical protein